MKTPPPAKEKERKNSPSASAARPARNRNSSRFAQWRQREMHLRLSAHFDAYRKNPLARLWNRESLAAELGCSPKTIGKDIATMKESLGYPLEFFPAKHGWMYTEPFTPVLAPSITKSELARIFLAFRAMEALKESPVFTQVLADIEKLIGTLTEHLGSDFASFSQCITFRSTGIDALLDPAIFETLITAIRNRQELEIVYSKLNGDKDEALVGRVSPKPPLVPSAAGETSDIPHTAFLPHPNAPWLSVPVETRIVHPLHLLSHDNALYLFLWDTKRKDIRCFALSRMRSVRPTGRPSKPHKFDLEEEIRDLFGVTSGKPVKVRIQFRGKASYLVAERPWHHTQELAPGPDEEWNLELTMTVAHTPELERSLMGYDQDFRVMEPASLAEAIDRKVEGMLAVRRASAQQP